MIINFLKTNTTSQVKKLLSTKLFSSLESNTFETVEQIKSEKRKRNQAYYALDYLLSRELPILIFSLLMLLKLLNIQNILHNFLKNKLSHLKYYYLLVFIVIQAYQSF